MFTIINSTKKTKCLLKGVIRWKITSWLSWYSLGLNQQDIADLLGITPQAYSLKENGKRSFKQNEMGAIYRMFSSIDSSITLQDIFLF